MAMEMEEVKLGTKISAFSGRVEKGLKIKGVKYEYLEEDLCNKESSASAVQPCQQTNSCVASQ